MNLGGGVQTTDGVAAVLQSDIDDAVDPHLERIRNETIGDESDEEVVLSALFICICISIKLLCAHIAHL